MARSLFGISEGDRRSRRLPAIVAARFVTDVPISADAPLEHDAAQRAAPRNACLRAHRRACAYTEWLLRFGWHTVAFRRYVPLRRRIMEGLLAATSLVLLWLIILAIDPRAGHQVVAALKTSVSTNGGMAMQLSDTASHVTRSAWELSFIYGPLMTFATIGAVLVIIMTRTAR
jgi:hypothetical protein